MYLLFGTIYGWMLDIFASLPTFLLSLCISINMSFEDTHRVECVWKVESLLGKFEWNLSLLYVRSAVPFVNRNKFNINLTCISSSWFCLSYTLYRVEWVLLQRKVVQLRFAFGGLYSITLQHWCNRQQPYNRQQLSSNHPSHSFSLVVMSYRRIKTFIV